ncbi:MAG: sugar ABC transporter substrate-binding protein [Clostridia bacterium]|nr:sugar ABC transporter substrate-binding protein [Clostridia bacterium]
MRKRVLLAALVLTVMASLVSGTAAAKKTQMRVVSWAGAEELAMDSQVLAEFMKNNPDVEVSLEAVSENYFQKVLTDIAAGDPPDVMLLDAEDVPFLTSEGALLNLTPVAARMKDVPGADLNVYFPNVLKVFTVDKAVYAFPKDFTPIVMYYNKGLFDSMGVAYPPKDGWDWNQFIDTAKKLSRDTNGDGKTDVWGYRFLAWVGVVKPWIWAAGGDIMNPERTKTAGYINGDAAVKTVTFMTGIEKAGYSPSSVVQEAFGGGGAMFYTGKIAMANSGHWWLPSIKDQIAKGAKLNIGITRIPHAPGAKNATVLYASGWAVPKNVKNQRLAVELASWLSSPYAQKVRCAQGLAISANKQVAEEVAKTDPVEAMFFDIVPDGRPSLGAETRHYRPLIEDTMDEALQKIILGGTSVKDALNWAAKTIDDEIAKRK